MITYLFFKYLILHIKYMRILKRVYKEENLLENLSKLFGTTFKTDWIGRAYTVINPLIQNGIYDPNNQIYEYNENGLINDTYVEAYIMKQLNIAKQFIKANNLFDLLTYEIKKIDDYGNYLFVIHSITWPDLKSSIKKMSILYGVLLILGIISIFFI